MRQGSLLCVWEPARPEVLAGTLLILPPSWITLWIRALALAAGLALVFWLLEARCRRVQVKERRRTTLSRRLLEAQEAERKRIAGELHDSLGQNLLVIKNRALLGLQESTATAQSLEQFTEISRMASASLAEVREISHDLRPYQLDRLGLTKALQAMVTGVSAASGLRCSAEIDPLEGLLESSMEIHFYRIVQELLNNTVKHSHASEARLCIKTQAKVVLLAMEDNGCGFNPAAGPESRGGIGLTDIAERVDLLQGTLHCESQRAKGTHWTILIPARQRTV